MPFLSLAKGCNDRISKHRPQLAKNATGEKGPWDIEEYLADHPELLERIARLLAKAQLK
jgi:Zn-dependent protease with chaperone function